MENVTISKSVDVHTGETIETVIIQHSNNDFTQMSKAEYDRRQVEHLTEIPTKATYEATLASESANDSKGNK